MSTTFTQLNGFSATASGVYSAVGTEREFSYSDGVDSERRLYKALSQSRDLSSASSELAGQVTDWPTEYHLSPARANLLRPLNLDGVQNILELGCGCGSITRYLGETTDAQIDAVEGSPIRADLAALRCQGLDNVTISTANFNDIEFPENYYDLVLFVGVTEYAGRFSERDTDQQALQDLLALAKRATKPDGATLIAIENRTGLKYVMGACEDHYGIPYVGIENYPNGDGIRTYTHQEWLGQIKQAGFAHNQFALPFPDYKVPTLLINETVENDAAIGTALAKIKSRDYLRPFDLAEQEARLWGAQLAAGTLTEFANSFMILLSDDQSTIEGIMSFDIAEFEQPSFAYLDTPVATEKPEVESLTQEVVRLQQKVALLTGSRGWKFLNKLRALFGKPTIDG